MKLYVDHTHKGSVDLNVNITVKSEEPLKKGSDEKIEKNKESIFLVVGTIYFGIFASLFAVFFDNRVKSLGEKGEWYSWIILGGAVLFLIWGFGYSFCGKKFNNMVFKALMGITYGTAILLVVWVVKLIL